MQFMRMIHAMLLLNDKQALQIDTYILCNKSSFSLSKYDTRLQEFYDPFKFKDIST